MARDPGPEHLLSEYLAGTPGLSEKAMFGGRAWLMDGNLLCGARHRGACPAGKRQRRMGAENWRG
jgi:hypothetical protein